MTLSEIASLLGGDILGDESSPSIEITTLSKIEEAQCGSLTFLANPKYEKYLLTTSATAVLVSRTFPVEEYRTKISIVFVRVDDPYIAFLRLLPRFIQVPDPFSPEIHPTAVIERSAVLGDDVSIGAYAVICDGARVGNGTKIGAGCVIGKNATVGNHCLLYPNVTVYHGCTIGNRVILHSGAVIGSDGFGHAPRADGTYEKIPQLGIVVIEDDVEIGANTTIDRATLGETKICRGVKIDNLVQIAHNVVIGENTVIAAQTGISGSTKIGKNCKLAGQVGIAGHIEIADGTIIMAQSGVPNSIKEPNKAYFGYPADEARKAQRAYAALKMLPDTIRELTALKQRVEELEKKLHVQQQSGEGTT
ncbi:MAG: UDP-3-O-(3-hydroxymyristoyl)glucosamine N-acyltransferase [Bacteroidetes bacterium]|nr:UDP-3-O-(3-hydroxymyristoyl)glucosamine N-acyltransferase [Bacteroidota bacterium]